jgi:hypothetical protein
MSAYVLTDMFNQVVVWTRINPIFELQTTKNINPAVFEEQKLKYSAALHTYINTSIRH